MTDPQARLDASHREGSAWGLEKLHRDDRKSESMWGLKSGGSYRVFWFSGREQSRIQINWERTEASEVLSIGS